MKSLIQEKLEAQLKPSIIIVEDNSHLHVGHIGAPAEGESHFKVSISSEEFLNKSLLDCHRRINSILASELANKIHALEIKIIR